MKEKTFKIMPYKKAPDPCLITTVPKVPPIHIWGPHDFDQHALCCDLPGTTLQPVFLNDGHCCLLAVYFGVN